MEFYDKNKNTPSAFLCMSLAAHCFKMILQGLQIPCQIREIFMCDCPFKVQARVQAEIDQVLGDRAPAMEDRGR
jgi:hypothetical protein